MATDTGIKIAKDDSDINSTDIDDYIFMSSIKSLPLIKKVTVTKQISQSDCNGSFLYTHNLGHNFFTLVFGTDRSQGNEQILPYTITNPGDKACDFDRFFEDFSYKIHPNNVEIFYDVSCIIPMVGGTCPEDGPPFGGPFTYSFDIYIYMVPLG